MEEFDLYENMKLGDVNAFNQIFHLHYKRIVLLLYKKCYDQSVAEDLAQSIFIDFWINRESTTINSSISGYLSSSARNKYIDYFRKQKVSNTHQEKYFNRSLKLNANSPEDQLLSKESIATILQTIETLPIKTKLIFQLSRFENMSYTQIAKELDISVKTVEYHISNALKILRKLIFFLFFLQSV